MKRNVPVLAVDGFNIELKRSEHGRDFNKFTTYTADISFTIKNGEDEEVVAAVRLSDKAMRDFIALAESKQHETRS